MLNDELDTYYCEIIRNPETGKSEIKFFEDSNCTIPLKVDKNA